MILKYICIVFLAMVYMHKVQSLDQVRKNYQSAVTDRSICMSMIKELESPKTPVFLAYQGGFQTLWAKHTVNPYTKFATFMKGKKNIDKAVQLAPDDVEIRFVRHSIQKNIPGFLGYKDNLKEDSIFLRKHVNTIGPPALKQLVKNVLKAESNKS